MAKKLFDTCVFLDYLNGSDEARRSLESVFDDSSESGYYSVWTVLELLQRPNLTPEDAVRRMDLLKSFVAIPLTEHIATDAALLASDLRNGNPATITGDAVIAVSAAALNCVVVTRNLKDFALLKAPIENY